jgi:hypothetical protein
MAANISSSSFMIGRSEILALVIISGPSASTSIYCKAIDGKKAPTNRLVDDTSGTNGAEDGNCMSHGDIEHAVRMPARHAGRSKGLSPSFIVFFVD